MLLCTNFIDWPLFNILNFMQLFFYLQFTDADSDGEYPDRLGASECSQIALLQDRFQARSGYRVPA